MAAPKKASAGHRFVAACIALFCVLTVLVLLGSSAHLGWYEVVSAFWAACGALVFGHVTITGRLPGRFKSGGNAFMGARRNMDSNDSYRSAPVWQRAICGALAVGSGLAIVVGLANGHYSWSLLDVASLALAIGGSYLFACIALCGHLPRRYPHGGNGALHHREHHSGD